LFVIKSSAINEIYHLVVLLFLFLHFRRVGEYGGFVTIRYSIFGMAPMHMMHGSDRTPACAALS
ncbi:MAG: hypothetical protein VX202_05005, partial [Pseudomonadota bacterium]|nr:hypothetical protein [Pseudomonadota bacterium]